MRSTLPGGFKSRPGPHPDGCAQQVQPLPHPLGSASPLKVPALQGGCGASDR